MLGWKSHGCPVRESKVRLTETLYCPYRTVHSPGKGRNELAERAYRQTGQAISAQNSPPVPPGQSLASRSVGNPTCQPGNGSTKLGGTRKQAALLSPEIGIVVDRRINLQGRKRGKALCPWATGPRALAQGQRGRRADRPGSKRGLAETWVMGVRLRPAGKLGG